MGQELLACQRHVETGRDAAAEWRDDEAPPAHPAPCELDRFFRGEADKAERCRIVRHLLRGCSHCGEQMRPLWGGRLQ